LRLCVFARNNFSRKGAEPQKEGLKITDYEVSLCLSVPAPFSLCNHKGVHVTNLKTIQNGTKNILIETFGLAAHKKSLTLEKCKRYLGLQKNRFWVCNC